MSDQAEPTLTQLKAEIDELREEGKQREPNVLGAIRTLTVDLLAWRQGQRDFPRAAVIGFAFAYMRPRVILAIGSVAAFVIALAQIWLIVQQNQIIEKQTGIMSGQERLAKAQIAAAILPGLTEDNYLSGAGRGYILAFGDIALEVVLPIILDQTTIPEEEEEHGSEVVWLNSALIVASNATKLTTTDANTVLIRMLRRYDAWISYYALSQTSQRNQKSFSELTIQDIGGVFPNQYIPPTNTNAMQNVAISTLTSSLANFVSLRPASDVQVILRRDKELIVAVLANHIQFSRVFDVRVFGNGREVPFEPALTLLCQRMSGGRKFQHRVAEHVEESLFELRKSAPTLQAIAAVQTILRKNCLAPDSGKKTEPSSWQHVNVDDVNRHIQAKLDARPLPPWMVPNVRDQ